MAWSDQCVSPPYWFPQTISRTLTCGRALRTPGRANGRCASKPATHSCFDGPHPLTLPERLSCMTDLLADMAAARQRFMDLVAEVRPELHRYCARMTGSVFDGEDVVQDTLAKAWYALAEMASPPALRPWLFRIAHNTAMDFLRRYEHRHVDADADLEMVADMVDARDRDEHAPGGERVEAALKVFAARPPVQRSALSSAPAQTSPPPEILVETDRELWAAFNRWSPAEWLAKHTSVSDADFVNEPHRHRFSVLLSRNSHLAFHHGQIVLTEPRT